MMEQQVLDAPKTINLNKIILTNLLKSLHFTRKHNATLQDIVLQL